MRRILSCILMIVLAHVMAAPLANAATVEMHAATECHMTGNEAEHRSNTLPIPSAESCCAMALPAAAFSAGEFAPRIASSICDAARPTTPLRAFNSGMDPPPPRID